MLTAQEKLYFILDHINDKRHILPSGKRIKFDVLKERMKSFSVDDLENIFEMLATDRGVIRIFEKPTYPIDPLYGEHTYYLLELTDKFDPYYAEIQQQSEYQEFTGKRPNPVQNNEEKGNKNDTLASGSSCLEITYSPDRRILINDLFELAKPNFNSENDLIFSLLYKSPNKTFTLGQLQDGAKTKVSKSLHKIVENLGFTGDIKRIFFDVSEDAIQFKNPVPRDSLVGLGIKTVRVKASS